MQNLRIVSLLFAIFVRSASAEVLRLDPRLQMTQYGHRVWRVQDGSLPGTPAAITQTADGYIWIATSGGLARFNGLTFASWNELTGQDWQLPPLLSLASSADGTLWLGSTSGLYKMSPGSWSPIKILDYHIDDIRRGSHDDLWAVRSRIKGEDGPLCRLTPTVQCYGEKQGVQYEYGFAVSVSPSGQPWMASSEGVTAGIGVQGRTYPVARLANAFAASGVHAVLARNEQDVLIGIDGGGFGLLQLQNGRWKDYSLGITGLADSNVSAIYQMDSGELLVGTKEHGFVRQSKGSTERYDHNAGLTSDTVEAFFEDQTHNLWVVTQEGVDEFYQPRVERLNRSNGLVNADGLKVVQRKSGEIWIAEHQQFDVVLHDQTHVDHAVPSGANDIGAIFADSEDRLWVNVNEDLALFSENRMHVVRRKLVASPISMKTSVETFGSVRQPFPAACTRYLAPGR